MAHYTINNIKDIKIELKILTNIALYTLTYMERANGQHPLLPIDLSLDSDSSLPPTSNIHKSPLQNIHKRHFSKSKKYTASKKPAIRPQF